MGWEKGGRYYTRSRKIGRRVEREYVGGGVAGEMAASLDAERRAERQAAADQWKEQKARNEAIEAQLADVCERADLLARAALYAAGYHQHKRQWRKRRGRQSEKR